ncbi:hypothetical protein [uncultured Methanobrevibacter sp.]|uniref:hypothetical protein n=1 Tax=uncultured Methanobrevibacter sp. TaxID=253161 RepID=UPI0025DD3989|nr:hypothetical protein [uncultured Methanobrevibacter sp.]
MRNSSKILLGFMLVMMICCVSAVSATDINGTDDAIITDDIAIDDVSEIVEEVEIDDASDDVVEEQNLRTTTGTVNGHSFTRYFNTDGTLRNTAPSTLTFNGYFDDAGDTFGNFKISKFVTLNVANATFNNIGFDLITDNLKLNGGTFTSDGTDDGAVIYVNAANVEVTNNHMNLQAPNATDYIAIDVVNSSNAKILHNTINYTCGHENPTNFNYVIRAKNSQNVEINYNEIDATLPLKDVNWAISGSIDADYVAGVAVENCANAKFKYNNLSVIGNIRAGWYPTLDAFIIAKSPNAEVENNKIDESDIITTNGSYSYIYGIDVYSCDCIHVKNNIVTMNGEQSGGHLIGGNGTGAAYCIQLSGNHTDVIISNNTLTTRNNGPNLGIYSQNYHATSYLKISGNRINVTGRAGSDPWSLVSGIELQDTRAEVYDNNITVTNLETYTAGNCAYGISYAQWINKTHNYNIHNNNVTVVNGDYAVYLLNDTDVSGSIKDNALKSITASGTNTGDNAISAGSNIEKSGNH